MSAEIPFVPRLAPLKHQAAFLSESGRRAALTSAPSQPSLRVAAQCFQHVRGQDPTRGHAQGPGALIGPTGHPYKSLPLGSLDQGGLSVDYPAIYEAFIADRREREHLVERGERHHVLPRCLGGEDEPENIVRLSSGDHLFAHILLAKIHGGGLLVAAVRMSGMKRYRGRHARERYQCLRDQLSRDMIGNTRCVGRVDTPETLKKRSAGIKAARAKPDVSARYQEALSLPEVREKLSAAGKKARDMPGASEKRSARLVKAWEDPIYRESQTARMIGKRYALGHKQSEEACRKKSEKGKAAWARRKAAKEKSQ